MKRQLYRTTKKVYHDLNSQKGINIFLFWEQLVLPVSFIRGLHPDTKGHGDLSSCYLKYVPLQQVNMKSMTVAKLTASSADRSNKKPQIFEEFTAPVKQTSLPHHLHTLLL